MDSTNQREGAWTLYESAQRLGHFRWLERQLFEILGGWASSANAPKDQALGAVVAQHFGFHSELLEARLPTVRELTPDSVTVAASSEVAAAIAEFRGIASDGAPADVLVGITRVFVPRLQVDYVHHLAGTSEVADGAVQHSVGIIMSDLAADRLRLECQLDQHLIDAAAVRRAGAIQSDLELIFIS